jgi:hypothetical protein
MNRRNQPSGPTTDTASRQTAAIAQQIFRQYADGSPRRGTRLHSPVIVRRVHRFGRRIEIDLGLGSGGRSEIRLRRRAARAGHSIRKTGEGGRCPIRGFRHQQFPIIKTLDAPAH